MRIAQIAILIAALFLAATPAAAHKGEQLAPHGSREEAADQAGAGGVDMAPAHTSASAAQDMKGHDGRRRTAEDRPISAR
jgi:hypothetical protein